MASLWWRVRELAGIELNGREEIEGERKRDEKIC
jgi:hypothetical protein